MASTVGRLVWRAPWWGLRYLQAVVIARALGLPVDMDAAARRVVKAGKVVGEG